MNRQYLKTLQERAQRLLQISSDEGSDHESLNVIKTKSPRLDLNDFVSDTQNTKVNAEFEDFKNTDVQLLKKCINLTNQNTELKRQMKVLQTQKSSLQTKNIALSKQIQNLKTQLIKCQEIHFKRHGNESPFNKLQQNEHFSFIDRSSSEGLKQKSQSIYNFASSKYNRLREEPTNFKQIEKTEQKFSKQILQLQQRLKVANQKKQNLEQSLTKQREKTRKLWKFLNQQIPQLKDIVTKLTNKVDVQVQSFLIRDINQNQIEGNFYKRNTRNNR